MVRGTVLCLSSCSLTMSNYLVLIVILRHTFSNLINPSSISLRPFHDSHPFTSTERTVRSNSFSFVHMDIPLSFKTCSMFLKFAPALPILIPTSFRMSPSLRTSHPRYTNLPTFLKVFFFSITTWQVFRSHLHKHCLPSVHPSSNFSCLAHYRFSHSPHTLQFVSQETHVVSVGQVSMSFFKQSNLFHHQWAQSFSSRSPAWYWTEKGTGSSTAWHHYLH